jgi:peroxiredoxin
MSLRALFGLALAISMTAMTAGAAGGLAGGEAPDFVLPSTEGPNIRLSELRGQIVLLAFAAARCGDCGAELGGLAETYERYRDAGVALLLVSLDRDPRDARGMTQAAADYPVLSDAVRRAGPLLRW